MQRRGNDIDNHAILRLEKLDSERAEQGKMVANLQTHGPTW
jgi:hypothetical protein